MQSYWFGDVADGRCLPFAGDVNAIINRIHSLSTPMEIFIPLDWNLAADCGICSDRADYLARLQAVSIAVRRAFGPGALCGERCRTAPDGADA